MANILQYIQSNSFFLIIWVSSLCFILILGIVFSSQENKKIEIEKSISNFTFTLINNNYTFFALICFSLFILTYIYLMLYGEDFAYHDNGQFNFFSASQEGIFFNMPIWQGNGRFWPLGLQEYNFISLISKSPIIYQLYSVIQFLITLYLCWIILSPFKIIYRLIISVIIITYSSFIISFFGLIFPERNLIFFLAIFIVSLLNFEKTKSILSLSLIFVSTQFLLYYKEPMFIFMIGFSISYLLFDYLKNQKLSNSFFTFIRSNWMNIGVILLSIVFLILYIYYMSGKSNNSYADERQGINFFYTLINYLKINPILCIFLLFFSIRLFYILCNKQKINIIWDSLAIGNLLYFLVYLKLNMFRWYYTAPVDFIAILYLVNINSNILTNHKINKYKLSLVIGLSFIVLITNLHYSSYAILARKKEIESRVKTATFLKSYVKKNRQKDYINLFFTANEPYIIMEFLSYLNYKNLSVSMENKQNTHPILIAKGLEKFPNNLCVNFRPFNCFYSSFPFSQDLITFLSYDVMIFTPNFVSNFPIDIIKKYKKKSDVLFHYQPNFRGIEKILYLFCKNKINESWLNIYIMSNFSRS